MKMLKETRLVRELCNFRRALALGVIGVSILSNLIPAGMAVALAAWTCLLLLVMAYLFDIAYHSVGRFTITYHSVRRKR